MARMTKAAKAVEDQVHAAYLRHADCVQINVMDLGKILGAGRDALRDGRDLNDVAQYRQN